MLSLGNARGVEIMGCPSCTSGSIGGGLFGYFGAEGTSYTDRFPVFNHDAAPFLGSTDYLRNIDTIKKALAYAAGGFHVSVARGVSGGCSDPSAGFMAALGLMDGKNVGSCKAPLARDDVAAAWSKAAQAYLDAYNLGANQGGSLQAVKAALALANTFAIMPYSLENVEPPKDPGVHHGTAYPEPAAPVSTKHLSSGMVAAASAGLLGLTAILLGIFEH